MDSRLLATIIIFPIWLTLVLVFRRHRQWLFYYLVAAFGLALMLVFMAEYFRIDQLLVNMATFHVNLISKFLFKIQMELLSSGRFQLFHPTGGTDILKLGIECSAVLESSIILALILFYPLFDWKQKILRASFGLVVTYVINILRLMIIVLMANKFGSDYIFLAHAGVARIFFFICELILYWYLMTKPTVKSVGDSITEKLSPQEEATVGHALKLRHALGQLIVIILVVGLSFLSFQTSDEWKKAFIVAKAPERPLIYQDETSLEPSTSSQILGEMTESDVMTRWEIKNLPAGEPIWKSILLDTFGPINFKITDGLGPVEIEIYLNGEFQNRTIIWSKPDEPIIERIAFEQFLNVEMNDSLEIKIKNLGTSEANFIVEIIKAKSDILSDRPAAEGGLGEE